VIEPRPITILVAGTDEWADDRRVEWYCLASPFATFLQTHDVDVAFDGDAAAPQPFVWSTALDGVPSSRRHVQWAAGGAALAYFARRAAAPIAVIAHSHGLQVVLYACAEFGLSLASLISVSSPVRSDMAEVARAARPRIGRWLHLHSDASDRWQWLGELFDGHLGIVRAHPLADRNDAVPGVGHTGVLQDPAQFHLWSDRGWLDWLQTPTAAVAGGA
jgi:hypothetical protein